jgi:hypothetical protein
VPVPYAAASASAALAGVTVRALFEHGGKLPSVLDHPRFEARFKPVQWTSARLERELGWRPRLSFGEAVIRSYGRV